MVTQITQLYAYPRSTDIDNQTLNTGQMYFDLIIHVRQCLSYVDNV